MTRSALVLIRRSLPEGFFVRLLMGLGAVLWGMQSFRVGQDDILSPSLYTALFKILDLDQWAAVSIMLGTSAIIGATAFCRICDFICATLMCAFWSIWELLINIADDNAITPVFCLVMAIGNAMTIWIILVRHPSYER